MSTGDYYVALTTAQFVTREMCLRHSSINGTLVFDFSVKKVWGWRDGHDRFVKLSEVVD